jgi:hypothetical protein
MPTARWSAGSPYFPNFVFVAATRAQLDVDLPAALEAHCGRLVAYRFLFPARWTKRLGEPRNRKQARPPTSRRSKTIKRARPQSGPWRRRWALVR